MKILMVGLSVRAMAQSAVRSGYRVVALDAFGDQDLRAVTETYSLHHDFHVSYSAGALAKASRKLSFDSVAYTSNLENHPMVLSKIAGRHKIIGNPPQVIRSVRRWQTLLPDLKQSGFMVPETILAAGKHEIDGTRRWLVKPILSGGGHGICFLTAPDKLPGKGFMLQEYIPGKPCSASFVANGQECVLLGITEQLIGTRQFGAHSFRYCGNILPPSEALEVRDRDEVLKQVNRLATYLTTRYNLTGVNGIDFILHDRQVWPTEINPRYSASMELIEEAYGLPIFHLHKLSVLGGILPDFRLKEAWKNDAFFGKAIVYAEKDAIAPDTRTWSDQGIHDIPAPGERLPKGSPVCTVMANGSSYGQTFMKLVELARMIKQQIYV